MYEDDITVDEHLDAVHRARKLIHMREAKASTNLDGQTINIGPGEITGYPRAFVETLSDEVDRLNAVIARVRKLHELVTFNNAACGADDCCGEYEEQEVCADCQCEYPCPTIKALDGER